MLEMWSGFSNGIHISCISLVGHKEKDSKITTPILKPTMTRNFFFFGLIQNIFLQRL